MKRALNITLWVLLFAGFFTLLSFSTVKHNKRICKELILKVKNADSHPLVNESTLENVISSQNFRIVGQKLMDIPVDQIEDKIKAISQVKEAKVFSTIDGQIEISVEQMKPIARVFNANGDSYYIDSLGNSIELSILHSARLVSITSEKELDFRSALNDNSELNQSVLSLINFINKDEFWRHQIVEIHIDRNSELQLTPRIGNHKILIGNTSELRTKFDKLWAFYQNCEKGNYWNAFSLVNLKYQDQIVCTKK